MARFILSKSKVLEQYNILRKIATVSYSLKTNFEVGRVLEELTDSFFSIHSTESLNEIKDKSRIWFFAQAWNKEEIESLLNQNIKNFVVDNEADLNILLKNIKDKKINLLLRMRLKEHTIHTGKYYVFGMYSKQINELIPKLRKNNSIEKLGIHFHRKTQNISEWSLKYELEQSLSKETLKSIDLVNIGGGLPGKYKNFRAEVMDHIFTEIKKLKDWLKNKEMIIEPGRFIAAPAIKLETEIKNIYNNNIVIDCSVYNSAMDTFVAHIRLLVENELEQGTPYTIKGSTPDSMDIFRYKVFLKDPKIGDKIVFLNAGAYNFKTDFCNLVKLETVITK